MVPTFEDSSVISSSLGRLCDSCEVKEHPLLKLLADSESMLQFCWNSWKKNPHISRVIGIAPTSFTFLYNFKGLFSTPFTSLISKLLFPS